MKTFTSKEIQKLAGVTHMQVSRWTELGIIEPFEAAKGRGRVRRFSRESLAEALVCKQLASLHMETSVIGEALHYLRAKVYGTGKKWSTLAALTQFPGEERAFFLMWWKGDKFEPYGRTVVSGADIATEMLKWKARVGIVIDLTAIIQEAERLASGE